MTESSSRRRGTFDRVAPLYDEARPGYPEALFDDVVALSSIPPRGRILEVGCGTGQATTPLARRGYRILCIELGENLAAVARRSWTPTHGSRWVPAPSRNGRRRRTPSTSPSRRRHSTGWTKKSPTARSLGR